MKELGLMLLALGGLWVGAELVIKGTLSIARKYNISELFIGLTLLAFGTDLPELFVIVSGAISKLQGVETSGLIIGETIGTAVGQIALTLGVVSLMTVIHVSKREITRDMLTLLSGVLFVFFLSADGVLSQSDGVILMLLYGMYFISLLRTEKLQSKIKQKRFERDLLWSVISLFGGFAILILSSDLTIDTALAISDQFGIGQSYVGILLVGLGTSLPELVTSVSAIRRKAENLAVGNIIGSTIFDILFALGLGSAISGFFVDEKLRLIDLPVLFGTCCLVLIFFATRKRMYRKEGIALLIVSLGYLAFTAWNGLA